MWVEPKDDPRLESVADKLATLTRQIDNADWDGRPVTNAQRNEARRLTNLQRQGILWEPKF
jgi:hypothetical protein